LRAVGRREPPRYRQRAGLTRRDRGEYNKNYPPYKVRKVLIYSHLHWPQSAGDVRPGVCFHLRSLRYGSHALRAKIANIFVTSKLFAGKSRKTRMTPVNGRRRGKSALSAVFTCQMKRSTLPVRSPPTREKGQQNQESRQPAQRDKSTKSVQETVINKTVSNQGSKGVNIIQGKTQCMSLL